MCMESWKEITSNGFFKLFQRASSELENLPSIPLGTAYKTQRLYSDPEKIIFMKKISRLLQRGAIKQVKTLEKNMFSLFF